MAYLSEIKPFNSTKPDVSATDIPSKVIYWKKNTARLLGYPAPYAAQNPHKGMSKHSAV